MNFMVDGNERTIYYVSHLGTGFVSIINGSNYKIIKEIEVGLKPHNIIVDKEKNIYVASDRASKITIINDLNIINKTLDIPNNGSIQVDSNRKRLYVCDTDKIYIYNLESGEKIASLNGFNAADCLRLDEDKMRLFVLDILQQELKIYDTETLKLVKLYKDIGIKPSYICIEKDGTEVYIANKGSLTGNVNGNIVAINLDNDRYTRIDFPKGSAITALDQNNGFLYAVNTGLKQIEVIDMVKKKREAIIKTTFSEIQRIKVSANERILLVTNRDNKGKGAVDKINLLNNAISDTIVFDKNNSIPFDIKICGCSGVQKEILNEKEEVKLNNNTGKIDGEIEKLKTSNESILLKLENLQKENQSLQKELISIRERLKQLNETIELKKNEIAKLQSLYEAEKEKVDFYAGDNESLKERKNYLEKQLFEKGKEKILLEQRMAEKDQINKYLLKQMKLNSSNSLRDQEALMTEVSLNKEDKSSIGPKFSIFRWLFENEDLI